MPANGKRPAEAIKVQEKVSMMSCFFPHCAVQGPVRLSSVRATTQGDWDNEDHKSKVSLVCLRCGDLYVHAQVYTDVCIHNIWSVLGAKW